MSVARFEKLFLHLRCQASNSLGVTYCESVFRKSLHENVEVFLAIRTIRNNTHFRIDSCDWAYLRSDISYLSECGVLCRLFIAGSFHNLQEDKRKSAPHFLFIYHHLGVWMRIKRKEMKKGFVLALITMLALSCNKFDDSAIWDKLNDHEGRIAYLEEVCKTMNANIVNLQTLVTALEANDHIINASPLVTGDGYTFTFKSGKSVVIYDGEDGLDGINGIDGKDGVNGKDGVTPVISVMQDVDGIYYWTVNNQCLLINGEKVRASAIDGNDGENGTNGTNGTNGINGTDGKDGITPKFKIQDDYWYISYDNGDSWDKLGKASGSNGLNGDDGDSFFKGVSMSDGFVQFTLNDDNETIIKVPYLMEDTLVFVSEKPGDVKTKLTNQQKRSVVHLIVEGYIDGADVRYIADQMLALEILDMRETNLAEVPAYAFCKGELKYGKETIREVYLPESCLSIGSYAFYGCINLKFLHSPGLVKIGGQCLQYCQVDKIVTAPWENYDDLSDCTIRRLEFSKNVTTATFPAPTYGSIIDFEAIVDTVYCHTGITSIGKFGSKVKNVIFEEPASIKVIETDDFHQCGMTCFVLPTSVETIQGQAFSECSSLEKFVIPQGSRLTKIETTSSTPPYGTTSYYGAFTLSLNQHNVSIICYLREPISINYLFYRSSNYHYTSNGILYVLENSIEKYKASQWNSEFADIKAIEDSEYANWGL